eukprot:9479251-Pyramimonas_sp.AAC.1
MLLNEEGSEWMTFEWRDNSCHMDAWLEVLYWMVKHSSENNEDTLWKVFSSPVHGYIIPLAEKEQACDMLNEMVRLQTKLKRGKDTHSTRGRTRADLTSWRVQFQDFWVNKMQRESIHGAVGSYGGVLTHWDDFLEHLANPDYFGRMAKMRVCVGDEVGGKECGINHQRE